MTMRISIVNSSAAVCLAGLLGAPFSGMAQSASEVNPAPEVAQSQGTFEFKGRVREKGTKKILEGVNVFVLPSKLKGTTDRDGRFVISGVPTGRFSVVVNLPGYQKLEIEDEQSSGGSLEDRDLYLEKTSYLVYETTVFGRKDKRDESSKSLTQEQFLTVPGAQGDPIKAVQNLPGVNRPPQGLASVIIQGSAPQDTAYQIDGHEVPIIFHFGGLSSVMLPEALERVDYLSAGFGPENGRANGGLVNVFTSNPRTDRYRGFGFFDVYNAGFKLEGPLPGPGDGGFIIGGRQSYVGEVLKSILNKASDDLAFTVAPTFSDLSGIFRWKLGEKDEFKISSIVSSDSLDLLFEDPTLGAGFSNKTLFYRLIPQWTHRFSPDLVGRFSLGFGRDFINFGIGSNNFDLDNTQLTTRGELDWKVSPSWKTQLGYDHLYTRSNVSFRLPNTLSEGGISNPFAAGESREASVNDVGLRQIGLYWRNEWRPGGEDSAWSLLPGIRTEWLTDTREFIVLPRFATKYQIDDSLFVRLGSGLYAQAPEPQQSAGTYGNPDLSAPRAAHLAISAEKDFREGGSRGFVLTGGLFHRWFYELVEQSTDQIERDGATVPEYYDNTGAGRAYGAEVLTRMELQPFTGWLSYTLSRSVRSSSGGAEQLFQYDQTHLLTAVAAWDLPANWRISSRMRYTTGNPYTPINGSVFDADNNVFFPVRGDFFSERLDPFFQLDVRVDKKWVFDTWILWLYLDIQNATNQKNVEQLQYAYDYSESAAVNGLPVVPSFGLKAEF